MKLGDFSFRLWNSREKHYITNNLCLVEFNHNPGEIKAGLLLGAYGNYDFIENYDDEIEIELWTGYCDKNGKNIYKMILLKWKIMVMRVFLKLVLVIIWDLVQVCKQKLS